MRQGALPEASQAFAASLAPGARDRFSLQLLVACAPENVTKAVSAVASEDLFILPVNVKGRACYRLCWGAYDNRAAADAALSSVPAYFRQGGVTPRVAPLGELLP
jgi:septal ring-binding cell division protein DamX